MATKSKKIAWRIKKQSRKVSIPAYHLSDIEFQESQIKAAHIRGKAKRYPSLLNTFHHITFDLKKAVRALNKRINKIYGGRVYAIS